MRSFEQVQIPANCYIANMAYLEELYFDLIAGDCAKLDDIFSGAIILSPPDFFSLANQILPYNENDIEILVHNLMRDGLLNVIAFQTGNVISKYFSRHPKDNPKVLVEINIRKLKCNLDVTTEMIKCGLLKVEECAQNIKKYLSQNQRKSKV